MPLQRTASFLRLLIGLALLRLAVTSSAGAILQGSIGSHDPSRMIDCDGTYYIYSTGGGMKYSTDRINWTSGPSPFAAAAPAPGQPLATGTSRFRRGSSPPSMKALVPVDQGIWAPDVIYYNHKYYLYYSVAARDAQMTAIGLMTSPTLNPTDPAYHWTDCGVVSSDHDKVDHRSSIDPCPFIDAKGDLWLSYGSGYANGTPPTGPTIYIIKLDNATGLASAADPTRYPVALGHIEASYVYYHQGYYYLFWNSGGCCNGAKSSYTIHMARSRTVTGPYVDRNGKPDSSSIFLAPTVVKNGVDGTEHGPGQIGILSEGGIDRCTYHYYPDSGRPVVGEETILWDADGWPVAGADLAPGTYKIASVQTGAALGVHAGSASEGAPVEQQSYAGSPGQRWTVAYALAGGTNANGYYIITSAGSGMAWNFFQSDVPSATSVGLSVPTARENQQWLIEQTGDGKYSIVSRASGEALCVPASGLALNLGIVRFKTGAGAQIGPAQEWTFSAP